MFPRFETFTKISFLLLNLQFRTSYPSFPLPTFKLPTSILNFPLYSLYPSNSKLARSIRILFDPLSYPSFTLEWSKNHESAALILDYSWSREVDRAEHEGVKLVRLGWVIDQGRTLDIASLSTPRAGITTLLVSLTINGESRIYRILEWHRVFPERESRYKR